MNFNDRLESALLAEGLLNSTDLDKIAEIHAQLDDIERMEDFKPMPGGVHPPTYYLNQAWKDLVTLRRYQRTEPTLTPDQQKAAVVKAKKLQQSNKGTVIELLRPIGRPELFGSINQNATDFIEPNGYPSTIQNSTIVKDSQKFIEGLNEYINYHKRDYVKLAQEITWMKSIGFNPGTKSHELRRWKFMLPLGIGELLGHSIAFDDAYFVPDNDGLPRYSHAETLYRIQFTKQQNRPTGIHGEDTIALRNWTHAQIEELIDTIGPVYRSIADFGITLRTINNVGTKLIEYALELSILNVDKEITISSADITDANSVRHAIKTKLGRQQEEEEQLQ